MFRYWDGHQWSPTVSSSPQGTPQTPRGGKGFDPTRPITTGRTQPDPTSGTDTEFVAVSPTRARLGWIAGIAAAVAMVVLIAWGVQGAADRVFGGGSDLPGVGAKRDPCPRQTAYPSPGAPLSTNGRVKGGKLSYPMLPGPWSDPKLETRVPFGADAHTQTITIEKYSAYNEWVASVLVAQLQAGDGFYTPQQGSEIVTKCVIGSFYGDTAVQRKDLVNQATTVDGHPAWTVESHLSFNIRGLKTKGELLIVTIVQTGDGEASLFYASIPDTARQWELPARQAMADLRVEG